MNYRIHVLGGLAMLVAACSQGTSPGDTGSGTDSGADVSSPDVTAVDTISQDNVTVGDTTSDTATTDTQGNDSSTSDVVVTEDVVVSDATTTDASSQCGTSRPTITGIRGSEGLVIAADGTIYYSQNGHIGRMRPGATPENAWASVPNATGIWGIALDAPNHLMYIGAYSAHAVYTLDVNAIAPVATVLPLINAANNLPLTSAGSPNGLTIGPDGAMYYSDFGGAYVYRVDRAGMRTQVNTTTIAQPNGVAFGLDGALYVDSYGAGIVWRIALSNGVQTGAMTAVIPNSSDIGSPDGLAFDSLGRFYVSDNSGGRLIRFEADGTGRTELAAAGSIGSAANIEFGVGALNCSDIYVASGGALYRNVMGTTPGLDVPWHH